MTDLQRFELTGTHEALMESGKSLTRTAAQTLFLFVVAAVVIFGNLADREFDVPFLNITLSRWAAAQTLIILSCASLFRFKAIEVTQKLLRRKLRILLDQFNPTISGWSLEYPSLYTFRILVIYMDDAVARRYGLALHRVLSAMWFTAPAVLLFGATLRSSFNAGLVFTYAVCGALLVATIFNQRLTPDGRGEAQIEGLDRRWMGEWDRVDWTEWS